MTMLSAMVGAPTRIRELGSGTEYSGSKRSELLIETTVRASTRVDFSAGRGATADTSAGAAARAGATLPAARSGRRRDDARAGRDERGGWSCPVRCRHHRGGLLHDSM